MKTLYRKTSRTRACVATARRRRTHHSTNQIARARETRATPHVATCTTTRARLARDTASRRAPTTMASTATASTAVGARARCKHPRHRFAAVLIRVSTSETSETFARAHDSARCDVARDDARRETRVRKLFLTHSASRRLGRDRSSGDATRCDAMRCVPHYVARARVLTCGGARGGQTAAWWTPTRARRSL